MVKAKPVVRMGHEYDGGVAFCRCRFRADTTEDQTGEQSEDQARLKDWTTRWEDKQEGASDGSR